MTGITETGLNGFNSLLVMHFKDRNIYERC